MYQDENLSYISAFAQACSFNMDEWMEALWLAATTAAAATRIHFVHITARRHYNHQLSSPGGGPNQNQD